MLPGMAVQSLKGNTYLLPSYYHYDLEQAFSLKGQVNKANLTLEKLFKVSLRDHTAFMITVKYL